MNPNLALVRDGKKFMWDGRVYDTWQDASVAGEGYRNDSFEVLMAEEAGKFLVYTRRVVREVVVAAQ
jgi:hypothetical protein